MMLKELGLGFGLLGTTNTAPISDEDALEIFRTAVHELGVNRFDTAPLYGGGLSEERLGKLLISTPRDDYILSTKVGRYRPYAAYVTDPKNNAGDVYDYSHDSTLRSIEKSLQRLRTDRLDIVFIHDCDEHIEAATNGAWPALSKLRDEGVLGRIGCGSNVAATHEQLLERVDMDIMMVANCYSLLEDTASAKVFPRCQELSVEVELAAPFNSGILATGPDVETARYNYVIAGDEVRARVRAIQHLCMSHGVALKQTALQYCLRHPAVSRLILGLAKPDELRSNIQELKNPIPDALWEELAQMGVSDPRRHEAG